MELILRTADGDIPIADASDLLRAYFAVGRWTDGLLEGLWKAISEELMTEERWP